jgi:hypothetical protein
MSKSRHKKKAAKQIAPVQPNQCIAMIPKGKIVCGDMTAFTIETNKNCGKDLFRVGAAGLLLPLVVPGAHTMLPRILLAQSIR